MTTPTEARALADEFESALAAASAGLPAVFFSPHVIPASAAALRALADRCDGYLEAFANAEDARETLAAQVAALADRVEAADAEIERLRGALERIANAKEPMAHHPHRDMCLHGRRPDAECVHCVRAHARAALARQEDRT